MLWLFLAVVVIIGGFFYYRKRQSRTITINTEQAEMFLDLIGKEKQSIADQMLDMADEAALKGKTVAIDSIIQITPDMNLKIG